LKYLAIALFLMPTSIYSLSEAAPLFLEPLLKEDLPLKSLLKAPVKLENSAKAFELTAASRLIETIPGVKTEFWTYNQGLPGPIIEVEEGDRIQVKLINQINKVTTLHWHGVNVPPDQDGNPMDPVKPQQSHNYKFSIPLGSAGTYWYHPHTHQGASEQIFRGMNGLFIVRDPKDPLRNLPEKNLFITDLKIDDAGQIPANNNIDWMDGREGNYVLINGQNKPVIDIGPNETQRWRLINATNARFLRFAITDHSLIQVGTDGGLLEFPRADLTEIILAPAERIELLVQGNAQKSGHFDIQMLPYMRGKMAGKEQAQAIKIATLNYNPSIKSTDFSLPKRLRTIEPLGTPTATKKIIFQEKIKMKNGIHAMEFLINGQGYDMMRVDARSKAGEVELWEVSNQSDMDHPFHMHGAQFQVIEKEHLGKVEKLSYLAWKDTFNLKSGETIRLKVKQDFKGIRMYHCHIAEHEDSGMMATLEVY